MKEAPVEVLPSVTTLMKLLFSLSEFVPFGPITFGKSRRAARFDYFIRTLQVSWALNWKLAGSVDEIQVFSYPGSQAFQVENTTEQLSWE